MLTFKSIGLVVLLLALCGLTGCAGANTSPSPQPPATPNPPAFPPASAPPNPNLKVTIDSLNSQEAIVLLSDVTANAFGSTGNGLSYVIDFGDGTRTANSQAKHVYRTAGTYTITTTVTDTKGRTATVAQTIAVKSVTGTWFHAGYIPRAHRVERRFLVITDQAGFNVHGSYGVTGYPDRPFTGVLSAPRQLEVNVPGAEALSGRVPSVINDETPWNLQMHGGLVDGEQFPFRAVNSAPTGPAPDAVLKIGFGHFGEGLPIVGLTPIEFDASTSRGEGLSYFMEFGDGQVAKDGIAVHAMDNGQYTPEIMVFSPLLTVVDRFGRVDSENTTLTALSLLDNLKVCCGAWVGRLASFPYINLAFYKRSGLSLSGYIYPGIYRNGTPVPCVATLSGERDIRIVIDALGIEFEGHFEIAHTRSDIWRLFLTETKGSDVGAAWNLLWDDGPG